MPAVGHDQDPGLVDQLVLRDPDRGAHHAVGPLLGLPDVSAAEDPTQRHPVLLVQLRHFDGQSLTLLVSDAGTRFARVPRALTGVSGRLRCLPTRPDRIPAHWRCRSESRAQVPFARRAVPLVRDRAPLVALLEVARPSSSACQPAARGASPAAGPPSAQRRHDPDAVQRADQPRLAAGELVRRGAALRHGRPAFARELEQQRPGDPGQDRRVVGHRAQRLALPPQQARVGALEQAPVARRRSTASPAPWAAARSRRAASRSRSGPLRRGARRGSGTSAIQATTVGSRAGAGRTRTASSPSARSSTRGNQRPRAGSARLDAGAERRQRLGPDAVLARRSRRSAPSGARRRARGRRRRATSRPPAAPSSARGRELAAARTSVPPTASSTARAFSSISSCSASGSDAATIAPPEPICSPSGDATSVRMTMLRSAVPLTDRKPSAPEYTPRGPRLEAVDDLHRAQLRRAGHRAAGERGADAVDRGRVVAQAAADRRDELVDGGVGLDGHERRHLDAAQRAHAAEVVAHEIDDHEVLGARLVVGAQRGGAVGVLGGVGGARGGALDRLGLDDPLAVDAQEALGRGAQHRRRRRGAAAPRAARGCARAGRGRRRAGRSRRRCAARWSGRPRRSRPRRSRACRPRCSAR